MNPEEINNLICRCVLLIQLLYNYVLICQTVHVSIHFNGNIVNINTKIGLE